jgi:hypothetical protein
MAMKTNKWNSQTEIPGGRDPVNAVPPKVAPKKKKPKSDLTLGFVDSSDYVRSLACQYERAIKIDRMRQSAVSNQRATSDSQLSMIPTKSQLGAIKKLAEDPTRAHAIDSPSPSPSRSISRASGSRLTRTMTSGTFKKKYSGLAGQTGLRRISEPNPQRTLLERKGTKSKSQFSPYPEPQAPGNNQLSLEDSWEEEENQMPELDVLDKDEQDEQEMKSQKSNRTVEHVLDEDDRKSDGGKEIKSIDEESEDSASRD